MEQFISPNFNLELPLLERTQQKIPFATCCFCGSTQVDLGLTLRCLNCKQLHSVEVKLSFMHVMKIQSLETKWYELTQICIYNHRWIYHRDWNHLPKGSILTDKLTDNIAHQGYQIPFDLIIAPENFNKIENILALL